MESVQGMDRCIAHSRGMLVSLLRSSTPMTQTEAKRMVKAVLSKEAFELPLADAKVHNAMRHALQSIGAEVEVQELAQPTFQLDVPAAASRRQGRE